MQIADFPFHVAQPKLKLSASHRRNDIDSSNERIITGMHLTLDLVLPLGGSVGPLALANR